MTQYAARGKTPRGRRFCFRMLALASKRTGAMPSIAAHRVGSDVSALRPRGTRGVFSFESSISRRASPPLCKGRCRRTAAEGLRRRIARSVHWQIFQYFVLLFSLQCGKISVRHNRILFTPQVCIFIYMVKMHALLSHTCGVWKGCVAAIGACVFRAQLRLRIFYYGGYVK